MNAFEMNERQNNCTFFWLDRRLYLQQQKTIVFFVAGLTKSGDSLGAVIGNVRYQLNNILTLR